MIVIHFHVLHSAIFLDKGTFDSRLADVIFTKSTGAGRIGCSVTVWGILNLATLCAALFDASTALLGIDTCWGKVVLFCWFTSFSFLGKISAF